MIRHSYGTVKIEPGQMYQLHRSKDIFVIIEPVDINPDGWVTFNITRSRYEWDMKIQFLTQYRRLA